nr:Asp23/Gls24 family envelope stress response protein [Chloroflexota bacterium]
MERKLGTVVISPTVLATIARQTTLSVPGVVQMSPLGVHRLWSARQGGGVKVQVIDDAVILDIYIVAATDVNMLQLSREIQSKVSRAIREIVGMAVSEVNVHIVDVEAREA